MARAKKYDPVDLARVVTFPLSRRANKALIADFARPLSPSGARAFFGSLPSQLKANDLRRFLELCAVSRKAGKPVHMMMGAHVIKVGLSSIIIDLMQRGIVTGVSFNGAGVIHDLELAFSGATSEDVANGLSDGSFGMARETADWYAEAIAHAVKLGRGLGAGAGAYIRTKKAKHAKLSILAEAERLGLPATIHAGIGTDIVAQHRSFDPAAVGQLSHYDFRTLCAVLADADSGKTGGVCMNIGSAAILPEVFLKALTVARNLNGREESESGKIITANFDMIAQYRPRVNVVERPTKSTGHGFDFVGHHEIMLPLLAWGLKDTVGRSSRSVRRRKQ